MSSGVLSDRFPEVSVTITSSFAHDRGMMSSISSLTVVGESCKSSEVLEKLVAHRSGWTRTGGKRPEDALQTFEHFVNDWEKRFEWSERVNAETKPPHMGMFAGMRFGRFDQTLYTEPAYHPPRIGLHTLEGGQVVVYHAFFRSWDAGTHGQLYDYEVEAYDIRDGASVQIDPYAFYTTVTGVP
ncbi:MAG: hypothetical protein AAFV53_20660 [Myxococcota bacterium]